MIRMGSVYLDRVVANHTLRPFMRGSMTAFDISGPGMVSMKELRRNRSLVVISEGEVSLRNKEARAVNRLQLEDNQLKEQPYKQEETGGLGDEQFPVWHDEIVVEDDEEVLRTPKEVEWEEKSTSSGSVEVQGMEGVFGSRIDGIDNLRPPEGIEQEDHNPGSWREEKKVKEEVR